MPLCSVGWGANFTAGRGTCLGGRPSTEIGNFGKLRVGYILDALSGSQARTLRRGGAGRFCGGFGKQGTRVLWKTTRGGDDFMLYPCLVPPSGGHKMKLAPTKRR